MKKLIAMCCIFLFFVGICYAQKNVHLKLKSGKIIEGELIEQTAEYIKLNVSGRQLTYWQGNIESIQISDGAITTKTEGLKISPKAKVLDEQTLESLILDEQTLEQLRSHEEATLVFNITTPILKSLAQGDIIVGGISENTPFGLAPREVREIREDGTKVIIKTIPATLTEVIEEGKFSIIMGRDLTRAECYTSRDCEEGFHCFKCKCISNDILNKFESCKEKVCDGNSCRYDACLQKCKNCKDGRMRCMHSSKEFANKKCVECFMDMQCKSGYVCKEYVCVKERNVEENNVKLNR